MSEPKSEGSQSDKKRLSPDAQIGRLALRVEGDNWCAYYVLHTDSMKDALLLGSIRMSAVADNPERKQQFMDLMREVVGDLIESITGIRPVWGDPAKAPEHERSRNG